MRIVLFVNGLDQIGGAEIAARRLAERLAAYGHKITILTTQPLSQLGQYPLLDYTKTYKVIRLPVWHRSVSTFRRMLYLQNRWITPLLLRQTQILHLRGLLPETVTLAKQAQGAGTRTVCVPMASGAYGDVAFYPYPADPTAFDWMSALTEPLRRELVAWGFPPERTGVIPNGVDVNRFRPSLRPILAPRVVFVGQFRPEKRVGLLLDAWTLVQREYPRACLTLVGGGRALPDYQERAAELGLSPTFVANTHDVLSHLHANSIFVLPGISEGMSNALLEAMAARLAPIVADTAANRAVIAHEVNGLTYEAESSGALASAILRLLRDYALRQRISIEARKTVVEHFGLDAVIDQYLALYARLLGETG